MRGSRVPQESQALNVKVGQPSGAVHGRRQAFVQSYDRRTRWLYDPESDIIEWQLTCGHQLRDDRGSIRIEVFKDPSKFLCAARYSSRDTARHSS